MVAIHASWHQTWVSKLKTDTMEWISKTFLAWEISSTFLHNNNNNIYCVILLMVKNLRFLSFKEFKKNARCDLINQA